MVILLGPSKGVVQAAFVASRVLGFEVLHSVLMTARKSRSPAEEEAAMSRKTQFALAAVLLGLAAWNGVRLVADGEVVGWLLLATVLGAAVLTVVYGRRSAEASDDGAQSESRDP